MSSSHDPYPRIEDLGAIGNCRTIALVSKHGAVEWLCLPRFDSPSVFGALLDRERGGRFQVRPSGRDYEVSRRYLGSTPVLQTTFHTEDGEFVLTDLMPVTHEEDRRRRPWPEHQVLRRIECTAGEVDVEAYFEPRPAYGRDNPEIEVRGAMGLWCRTRGQALTLMGDIPLEIGRSPNCAYGRSSLSRGDVRWLSLTYTNGEPAVILDPLAVGDDLLGITRSWWEEWAGRCRYHGPFRGDVVRSAVTLKLLSYAPSGAVVAAATTSLPEVVGGERNWDYRYCWLRDASWTLRALGGLGYGDEAKAFYDWMIYATRLTAPALQTVYDIRGGAHLDERRLDHLSGYEGSRPVRVGNGAHDQFQLDVYGEVVVAAFEWLDRGGTLDRTEKRFLVSVAEEVCRVWTRPDDGIWEIRGGPRHHTYSKAMAWAALSQIVQRCERGELDGIDVPVEEFRDNMTRIRDEIEEHAYDPELDGYSGVYGEPLTDAALLRLPSTGYLRASDSRMRNTYEHILETLGNGDGLLYRYDADFDALEGREGTFDLCSFWALECQALAGDVDGAREGFLRMCDASNDLGLYSEQTDLETGRFLGNFPQAFTHIGLISAALTIDACGDRT